MEKKYQVFISSTYKDLFDERKKVINILLSADCIPAGMEAFVATDEEQFSVIKKVIDLCDYYILILGNRYGSINEASGISYTEMEYDYAITIGIPVLVFALNDESRASEESRECQEKLKAFRNKAMKNRLASMWTDSGDLQGKVALAIMKAKETYHRTGWQRAEEHEVLFPTCENSTIHGEKAMRASEEISLKDSDPGADISSKEYAFDTEKFAIYYINDAYDYDEESPYDIKIFSWKKIFRTLCLYISNKTVTYAQISNCISSMVGDNIVRAATLDTIVNQFIALGLLQKIQYKSSALYRLTPKGSALNFQLSLVPKGATAK